MENKRLPVLCEAELCTGCGACAQSCTRHAISMRLNSEGYYNPVVNPSQCIGCLLCEKKCPILSPKPNQNYAPKAYSCWTKDNDARVNSSSGGAFTAIALTVLNKGGIVWGAGYSEKMIPIYKFIENVSDLNLIRGSKYVQCQVGESYKLIKEQLAGGRTVLFCGTPCHVAGLYAFLGKEHIENLLTVDFICHGVPSSQLFTNYIKWLEHRYGDTIIDFNFRESRFGINYNVATSATFKTKGKKYLYLSNNSFTLGFCRDLTIHDACVTCKFRGLQRYADFTIGDFHGAKGEYSPTEQIKGISCLIVNSSKANSIISEMDIYIKENSLDRIIDSNPSYTRHGKSQRKANLCEFVELPYSEVQERYFKPSLKDKVKTSVMLLLGGRLSYIIKNIM